MKDRKILGEERRKLILEWLKESNTPITGRELAERTNVSRQVIVGDISILKAKQEPIIATSEGYLYLGKTMKTPEFTRKIACYHPPERTEEELFLLVDHGVTVKDVIVEHPVYGDLTASIMVSNRLEVNKFMEKIRSTNSSLLSELTNGIHLHTIAAPREDLLDKAENALRKANFLIDQ